MKVLLVANYIPDRQRSMARYADMLFSELRERGHSAEIVRPLPFATRIVSPANRMFRWLAYIDKYLLFPPLLWHRSRRFDLVHVCDHSNSMYLRWTGRTPRLITAHDALAIRSAFGHFPQNHTRASGVALQRWILGSLRHANRIVCVSEKTRSDFSALLPDGPVMSVIPNPLVGKFAPATFGEIERMRETLGLKAGEEYLLHVGKDTWYKNRPGVLRIMSKLRQHPRFSDVRLVMAGAPLPPPLRSAARELGWLIECKEPSDEQLRALYSGALALLFPSLEEGFGWPILEAQACGCPVITTARPPMSEVAGAAAVLIDPEDAVGAAQTIIARIGELEALRSTSLENVRNYSLEAAMRKYCAVYREVAANSRQA